MSKNILNVLSLVVTLFLGLTRIVCADIAPDPISRTVSYLPIVLIVAVVIIALLLIKKFFKK
ncbi:MAG: hypothetical protein IKS51_02640 [Erysipelotrichaceae bacterium]|nr:hypothetical protein [Erysipelotrichaceae bacterium]